jgi:hypothetical protein
MEAAEVGHRDKSPEIDKLEIHPLLPLQHRARRPWCWIDPIMGIIAQIFAFHKHSGKADSPANEEFT